LANIRSAEKRWRQSIKRRERNRVHVGAARTMVARARRLIAVGNSESEQAVRDALKALDLAAERGTVHRNNSARRKSRLMKAYNLMVAEQTAAAAEAVGPGGEATKKRTARKRAPAKAAPSATTKKAAAKPKAATKKPAKK
jgi:small subunit ribosomal protein S20